MSISDSCTSGPVGGSKGDRQNTGARDRTTVPSGISKIMKTHSPRRLSSLGSIVLRHPTRWLLLAGVLIVFAISITTSPLYQPVPGPDSGVFLYVGQQILDGKIPYKDVWDHKPPAVHYINALGLLMGGGSKWGVWTVEFLALLSAACLGYIVMHRAFGARPAILGSAAWLFSLPFTLGFGNEPEVYALPFQFGALYFVQRTKQNTSLARALFLVGVLTAVCLLLKQNLIGIGLSIAIVIAANRLLARDWKGLARQLTAFGIGVIGTLAAVSAYFWSQNALEEALKAPLQRVGA